VSETRDGTGGDALVLRQWPVIAVSSLTVDATVIPQATSAIGAGWTCEAWDGVPPGRPQLLSLSGFIFGCAYPAAENNQNVLVTYQAGYQVTNEAQTISGGGATVNAPYGAWASDAGVTYANGTALTKVAGAPAIGQYALGSTAGTYVFSSGDNGASILISYGFVPSDLADACIELVSERYKYSERIGEKTHSLGGNETVSFDNARFTPLVAALLEPYRNLLPQ